MDTPKPVQPSDASSHVSRWPGRRVYAILILLVAGIFAASWWLTPVGPYATLNLDSQFGWCLFSPDATMLITSGGEEKPLRVWDVEGGHEKYSIAYGWMGDEGVRFSPDSRLIAAHKRHGDLKLWNARTGEEIANLALEAKDEWVTAQFSPDGRFLVFQDHNSERPDKRNITFWNIESRREQGRIALHWEPESDSDHPLAFSPDGKTIASFLRDDLGKVNEVLLWKIDQVPVLAKRHLHPFGREVAFSPDLKTLVAADDLPDGNGQLAIWDMMSGEKRGAVTFRENGTHLLSLSFIANGKVLSEHGDNAWRRSTLWDVVSTPREIDSFSEREPAVSPDGEWMAVPLSSGTKLIRFAAPERGADLLVHGDHGLPGFGMGMMGMGGMGMVGMPGGAGNWPTPYFSPDSRMIAVKGLCRGGHEAFLQKWLSEKYNPFRDVPDRDVVRVWDMESHRGLLAFDDCRDAWFSPDGRVLATLRDGTAIDLWRVPFCASVWRIVASAVIAWLMVVSIYWLGFKARKMLFSRRTVETR